MDHATKTSSSPPAPQHISLSSNLLPFSVLSRAYTGGKARFGSVPIDLVGDNRQSQFIAAHCGNDISLIDVERGVKVRSVRGGGGGGGGWTGRMTRMTTR